MIVDSHCHLADKAFDADRGEVVARAKAAGLSRALCILSADEPDEVARAQVVTDLWPAVAFAAGVHPHRAGTFADDPARAGAVARAALETVRGLALGEIGLDYHYDFAPPTVQQEVFAAQVATAVALQRPVVIHTREAMVDTMAVLRDAGQGRVGGVMHCFTGTANEAREALDLGFYISMSGIVSFPRAEGLREVARLVPADRLLVETDAPYLAPVPHRGKRNEPAFVTETLDALARARGVRADELAGVTSGNFDRLVGS